MLLRRIVDGSIGGTSRLLERPWRRFGTKRRRLPAGLCQVGQRQQGLVADRRGRRHDSRSRRVAVPEGEGVMPDVGASNEEQPLSAPRIAALSRTVRVIPRTMLPPPLDSAGPAQIAPSCPSGDSFELDPVDCCAARAPGPVRHVPDQDHYGQHDLRPGTVTRREQPSRDRDRQPDRNAGEEPRGERRTPAAPVLASQSPARLKTLAAAGIDAMLSSAGWMSPLWILRIRRRSASCWPGSRHMRWPTGCATALSP